MKKAICIILSLFTVFSVSTATALASDNNNTYTETVKISYSEYGSFSPESEIERDGKKYKLIDCTIKDNSQKTFTVITDGLKDKKFNAPAELTNPDNSSQKGKLLNTTFSENKNNNRTKEVSKTVNYSKMPLDFQVSKTHQATLTDNETGKTITTDLPLSSISKSKSYWTSIAPLKGSVTGYDSLYYILENTNSEIPKNEKQPIYKGYENAILKSLNLDSNSYKITGSAWVGDTYYNSENVLCRSCIYYAQAKVCDFTAVYSDNITLPETVEYTATSIYEDENVSQYTIELNYELINDTNTKVIVVGTVLGLFIIAILIAAVMTYLSKKKKQSADLTIQQGG